MCKKLLGTIVCLMVLAGTACARDAVYRLENKYMTRNLEVRDGILRTQSVVNKLAHKTLRPTACEEFALRLSDGTDKPGTARRLTTADFTVGSAERYRLADGRKGNGYRFELSNRSEGIDLTICYELARDEAFARKYMRIRSRRDVVLERIDVESVTVPDALQNYRLREITANSYGHWRPGLGQPLYTTESATFWGTEFPAATNQVENGRLCCGYLRGFVLKGGDEYATYRSVVGVADDAAFTDDAFYAYIDRIRRKPLRLQIQYNSWFDFGQGVSAEKFTRNVRTIHNELVTKRGCQPLNAYVIDDGWQDANPKTADWRDKVWTVNKKFAPDFSACFGAVGDARSRLGLWLSPASILGSWRMVPRMREYGFEALDYGMSMTGATYMQKLEDRIIELARMGVSYFKFDGLFGHLIIRDFELNGRGTPAMPQLETEGFSSHDKRLNDSKYDELQLYYLTAGTERLIQLFNHLNEVNPDIFTAITNGAYLSPWWMQYVDIVWLINADDAAAGNNRTGELVYRDDIYHQIWAQENTKFPMCSVFNHEPKKTSGKENPDVFRNYLYMNLSRGTCFIELYLKTEQLTQTDWDIMAEGLKWARDRFPAFSRVRMHGGQPGKGEAYGYSGWNNRMGYISIHNPSDHTQRYEVCLDRRMGLVPDSRARYRVSSPVGDVSGRLAPQYRYGDRLSVELQPGEILILDFTRTK